LQKHEDNQNMNLWHSLKNSFIKTTLDQIEQPNLNESYGLIHNTENLEVTFVAQGILKFVPKQINSDNVLILSAAVHGNETAPLELLNGWCSDLFNNKLKLSIPLLLIIGNPSAIRLGKRFSELNLNRLFNNKIKNKQANELPEEGKSELLRAIQIMKAVDDFVLQFPDSNRFHFDLHTAIRKSQHPKFLVIPFQKNEADVNLINFWSNCGLSAALQSNAPASTFSYYSQSQFSSISATVELGQVASLGKNDLSKLKLVDEGVRAWFEKGTWPIQKKLPMLRLFKVKNEILKSSEQFKLNISDDLPNFSQFTPGYVLAEDQSTAFQYRVESENEVIIFPNTKVPVGQRAALIAE